MKKIILGLLLALIATQIEAQTTGVPLVRFGLIADIQYCDCETANKRYYRNSLQKLEECVEELNTLNVQFTVNLGDLVDRDTDVNLTEVMNRLHKLQNKCYNNTGNHDYGGITNNKALFKKLGMPAEYYTFKYGNWVFIMLNTNELASYSNITGTNKEKELTSIMDELKAERRRNTAPYNGGISQKQMEWLKKQLSKAERKANNVMILSHHPLYPDNGLSTLNDKEILELLSHYSCVKAAIAGHHHPGAFGEYNGIPFITTEGMIETEDKTAYGIVELYPDKIIIQGRGRTKSYELPIR